MGQREPVALLSVSSSCLVMAVWLFLAVPWVCLLFVSVVFPYHTHLLFLQDIYLDLDTMTYWALLQGHSLSTVYCMF